MKRLITLTAIALLGSSLAQRQTLFNIGSYRLYMACEGAQSNNAPTILLATGFGRGSDDLWARVTPGVAKFARVCRYDRANIGKSDRANGAATHSSPTHPSCSVGSAMAYRRALGRVDALDRATRIHCDTRPTRITR